MSQIIGNRFEVGQRIGQGGMATVYSGRDTLMNNTPVAVKLLRPEIIEADAEIVERFEREGEALRRLNHPNIVKVLATVTEDDRHYVVMEYVDGGDLRVLLDAHRQRNEQMSIQRVLEIALDLSDALIRAHRLKIIHRDIKPANVLIAADGTPRLTDFGVAHFGDSTRMTQTGAIIGTLAYLSPEGCTGSELAVQADIWAFGVMLYEMLTLQRPFEENSSGALVVAIMSKDYTPLSQLRPDVPPALEALVDSMLVKEPELRLDSARLLGAQIEAIIQGKDTPSNFEITPASAATSAPPAPQWPTPPADVDHGEFLPGEKARQGNLITSVRQLSREPRLYISYRQAQDTTAKHLYERLAQEFGADNVVKDAVAATPLGASFQDVLEEEIGACDAMLVVIGPDWANTGGNQALSSLEHADSFTRIEVETALNRPGMLVIPVIMDGATMPAPLDLPPSLRGITQRNSAILRDDANFDRDMQWLIEQLRANLVVSQSARRGRFLLLGAVALVALLALIGAAVVLGNGGDDPEPTPEIAQVEPVGEREFMILLAQIERLGGADERDVAQFIADDLRTAFEANIDQGNLRIRDYPDPIRSDEQAQAIAEANAAAIVIWGSYDDGGVDLQVQVGSLAPFPRNPWVRGEVEAITDARLRLTNERRESLVPSVVAIMNILHTLDEDPFNVASNLLALEIADVIPAEVVGNSAAAQWHRYIGAYQQPEAGLEFVNQAIDLNQNAVYYMGRSLAHQQLDRLEDAEQDIRTARNLGPEGWFMPELTLTMHQFFLLKDPAAALETIQPVAEQRQDDWYTMTLLGGAAYYAGEYDLASTALERALNLEPDFNLTYFLGASTALRQDRIRDAQTYIQTARERFPDPTQTERILEVAYAITVEEDVVASVAASFGNLLVGQWNAVIELTENSSEQPLVTADVYLLLGLAHCNLGNYAAAEANYTQLIEVEPDYTLAYLLRAEVRREQENTRGVLADFNTIRQSDAAQTYLRIVPAVRDGEISCRNLFDYDLQALFGDE